MADYSVDIQGKLSGFEKLDEYERKIKELDGKTIDIKINVPLNNLSNSSFTNNIGKNLGKPIGNAIGNNVKSQVTSGIKSGVSMIGSVLPDSVQKALNTSITSKGIGIPFNVSIPDSDNFQKAVESEIHRLQSQKNTSISYKYTTDVADESYIDIYGNEQTKKVEKLTGAIFKYKTATGEAITQTMRWAEIGKDSKDNAIYAWVQGASTYSKEIDVAGKATDDFSKRQKKVASDLNNTLKQLHSNAFDQKQARPITSSQRISELESLENDIKDGIIKVQNATPETIDDEKLKVDSLLTDFKVKTKEAKNADNVASSLKGTDFASGKQIAENNFKKLRAEAQGFGLDLSELENKFNNISDASSLNEFNDALKVSRSELSKLKSQNVSNANNEKLSIGVSKSQSELDNYERIDDSILKHTALINNEKVSVKSLRKELDSVKTSADLSVVNKKMSAFVKSAEAKGIKTKKGLFDSTSGMTKEVFKTTDLQKKGKIYFSKVRNTLEKMTPSIESKFSQKGYSEINVTKGIEDTTGKIKSFTVTARDATGALKQFNFERAKLQGNGKAQDGFIQQGDVKVSNVTSDSQKKISDYTDKFSAYENIFNTLKPNVITSNEKIGAKGFNEITTKISSAESAMERFNEELVKGSSANLDVLNESLNKFKSLINSASNQYDKLTTKVDSKAQETEKNKLEEWWNKNDRAHKDYSNQYAEISSLFESEMTSGQFSDAKSKIKEFKSTISKNGKTGTSPLNSFKRAFKQIFEFAGAYGIIQNVVMEVPKQMIQAAREINSAQIELTKVSDAPSTKLNSYWDEAAESAKKYGATVTDVISSTADWSRLGYNLDDAKKLSDATTLLQKVGDNMTQESSASGMMSVLKGFQMDASQAETIVDKVNQVANTQPIDTSGLFEGLERSASSMDAANNSLDQTIALITAANSVVQDPDSIGTAFKTISMRIRGATTDMEEAGLDTDGMAESTAKLREEIKALSGVDIMKNDTEFKSTYDILDELSAKWQDLTDIQQASVTELIAGKRQGNIVSALMSNFDIARETLETSENESDGSAQKELKNYQKGIEYSINKFKASFQALSSDFIDSDIFKGLVEGVTLLTSALDKLVNVAGGVPAVLATIGAVKLFKNSDLFFSRSLHT